MSDERFDRDLREILGADLREAAPAGLRERIGSSLARGRRRSAFRRWLAIAAAGLVIAVGIATMTTNIGRPLTPPASQPGTGEVQPSGTGELPTLGPTLPPVAEPITHPGILQEGGLITEQDGWALDPNGRLLLTSTGGATWRDASPADLGIDMERISVLDPLHLWLSGWDSDHPSGDFLIWQTVDGGRSWQRSEVSGLRSVGWQLEFLDSEVGWLGSDPGGQKPKPELRWTTDGAKTWSEPIDITAATGETVFPFFMSFKDAQRGYYPANGCLRQTDDGGRTWFDASIQVPGGVRGELAFHAPRFTDAEHGWLIAYDNLADGTQVGSFQFVTDDGGDTWLIASSHEGEDRRSWSIVDASTWIASDGEQVWRTADRGATWEIDPVTGFPASVRGFRLGMVDTEVGWAAVTYGAACVDFGCPFRAPELFQTSDGARTWTRLGDCEPGNELTFICPSTAPKSSR